MWCSQTTNERTNERKTSYFPYSISLDLDMDILAVIVGYHHRTHKICTQEAAIIQCEWYIFHIQFYLVRILCARHWNGKSWLSFSLVCCTWRIYSVLRAWAWPCDNVIRFCAHSFPFLALSLSLFLSIFIIIMCVYGPTIICHWMVIIIACSCRFMCAWSLYFSFLHFLIIFLFVCRHKFVYPMFFFGFYYAMIYNFVFSTVYGYGYDEWMTIYLCFKHDEKPNEIALIECTKRPFP